MSPMMSFEIDLPIKPQGKQRPRIVKRKNSPFPVAITPDETVAAEHSIRWLVRKEWDGAPWSCAVQVEITATLLPPKSIRRSHPTVKPDWDNIGKLVCDALNGVCWRDDSQIVSGTVIKTYGQREGIRLRVIALP